jgi:hypothetical protein
LNYNVMFFFLLWFFQLWSIMMSFGLISHDCEFLFLYIIVILLMFPFSSFPLLPHLDILFSCFFIGNWIADPCYLKGQPPFFPGRPRMVQKWYFWSWTQQGVADPIQFRRLGVVCSNFPVPRFSYNARFPWGPQLDLQVLSRLANYPLSCISRRLSLER